MHICICDRQMKIKHYKWSNVHRRWSFCTYICFWSILKGHTVRDVYWGSLVGDLNEHILVHDPFLVKLRIFQFFNSCFYFKILSSSPGILNMQRTYSREAERNPSCSRGKKGGGRDGAKQGMEKEKGGGIWGFSGVEREKMDWIL